MYYLQLVNFLWLKTDFWYFFLMTKSICKGLYSCECDKMVLNIPKKVAMLRDIGLLGVMTFGLWEMLRRPLS